jgi:hypothetical protein
MLNRRHVLGVVALLCTVTSIAYADQPWMKAARVDLLQARTQLGSATHNKGGHRVKALEYVNSALDAVNEGIRFDRRHNNHAQAGLNRLFALVTLPDQPHMQKALEHLQQAKGNLESATPNKGGWRVKALEYVNKAIDETKQGIEAGE